MKIGKSLLVNKTATLSGHRDCIYALAEGATSAHLFSAGGDGLVVLWDLNQPENGELIAQIPKSIYALCYHRESNALLVGQNNEGVHLIDLYEKREKMSLKLEGTSFFDIKIIGQTIVVAAQNGNIYLLDLNTLKSISVLAFSRQSARQIVVNESALEMAVAYSGGMIRIFELGTWRLLREFMAHEQATFTLKYAPDGSYLISGGRDAHLKIWNTSDYTLKQDIAAHLFTINDLAFSPDAAYMATCSMDKSVKIWDAQTFQLLKVVDKARHAGHGTSINKVIWTSFDNQIVAASDDRTISVWHTNLWE